MPRSVQYVYRSQNLLKLNMQCQRTIPKENTKNKPPSLTFSKIPRTWSFHVVVLQRTDIIYHIYNTRAQLLFCSLNLLFCGVLVAVAVVVCLRSLLTCDNEHHGDDGPQTFCQRYYKKLFIKIQIVFYCPV